MNTNRLILSLMMMLAITLPGSAQSPNSKDGSRADEQKKAEEELEGKALELMNETIKDMRSLRSPANRIRLLAGAAETLWKHDEKKARDLLREAAKGLGEIIAELDSDDPQFEEKSHRSFEMRHQIIQTVSHLSPHLALDFLNATRQPGFDIPTNGEQLDFETTLRLRVAGQTVDKDPSLSLKIAEESLEKGFSHEITGLVYQLYHKDKQLGERLAVTVIEKLRGRDLLADPVAAYAAVNLLSTAMAGNRATPQAQDPANADGGQFRLSNRATSELMEIVVRAAVSIASKDDFLARSQLGHGQVLFSTLLEMRAELEKHAPLEAKTLESKLEEYKKTVSAQSGLWGKYQNIGSDVALDDYLKAIEDAPREMRSGLYQQAAFRAMNNNDIDRARQIATEKITESRQRKEVLSNIERHMFWRSVNEGKIEEARQMIGAFPQKEERAMTLSQLAMTASGNGDKKTAMQLIAEAQAVIGDSAESYSQIQVQLQIASAYALLDPGKSFDIIEQGIDRFNQLIAAASILDGFDIQHYFSEGELALWGGNQLAGMLNQCWEHLGTLARTDFNRARAAADRFQRFEAQTVARLRLVRGVLSQKGGESSANIINLSTGRRLRILH